MTSQSPLNFANQDLRNCSFKGKNLSGADFNGADIRGCDFSHALLQGANFERTRTGSTPKQLIPLVLVAGIVAWLTTNAFSVMIFASLGTTSAEPAWSYVLALGISLAIAGAFCGVRVRTRSKSRIGRFATIISGTASGTLLGFYYGGTTSNNNPTIAIAGAVFGGVVMAIAIALVHRPFVNLTVAVGGTVASYGFAFFIGAISFAHISVLRLMTGVVFASLSVAYLWLTINSLTLVVREIKEACGTSFKGADLTDAKFDRNYIEDAELRH